MSKYERMYKLFVSEDEIKAVKDSFGLLVDMIELLQKNGIVEPMNSRTLFNLRSFVRKLTKHREWI